MDFHSLGENAIVHVIRKKPFAYLTGTLKSKNNKQQQNPYIPQATPPTIDAVVTVGGSDEVVPGIPQGMEVVEYRNSYYSVTPEGAQQAIGNLMQMASNGKAEQPYYDSVLVEGEKALERINPQYAEGKRQARTIEELQARADAQDRRLAKMEEQSSEMLNILRQFNGDSPKK